ncbi:MAG: mevalonate kinase, partial [Chloroflexota bacterium]
MPDTRSTAPGKVILFGEHAVVYGRPAIAVPVTQVQATATVEDSQRPGVHLFAPDLGLAYDLAGAAADDPLAAAVRLVQQATGLASLPALTITLRSTIPIAGGMGSGAATAAAVIRALALHLGRPDLAHDEQVSALTYQVEQLHHGTPSGIDNTVVSYGRPVYFVRQQPTNRIETFAVATPLRLLVGDTGVRSSTKVVVGDVRRQWQADPEHFEALFDGCGRIAVAARSAIEQGDLAELGQLMNENHRLLVAMTVSSPELDRLVEAAVAAGAVGAKL